MTFLGHLSRMANWLTGGEWPQTLCARIAYRWGVNCVFCKLASHLIEPDHCGSELEWWLLHKHRKP